MELLDHVIPLNERHLRRLLRDYVRYYHLHRTHDGPGKDTPYGRPLETNPGSRAKVISLARVGGLHHRYGWQQAARLSLRDGRLSSRACGGRVRQRRFCLKSGSQDAIRENFTELNNQGAAREARFRRFAVAGFDFGDTQPAQRHKLALIRF
jgi:hypothetical protein